MIVTEMKYIIDFLVKSKVNELEIFTKQDFTDKSSVLGKFFNILKEEELKDLNELKSRAYGLFTNESTFKKTLLRFKEKLSNTLFFVDQNSPLFSDRARAYYQVAKRTLATRMLSERGAKQMARELAENTIPVAAKYEFTELNLLLSRFLLKQYATIGDVRKTNQILSQLQLLNDQFLCESELDAYTNEIIAKTNSQSNSSHHPTTNIQSYWNAALKALDKYQSVEIVIYSITILGEYYLLNKDYTYIKSQLIKFRKILLSKSFYSPIVMEVLLIRQLKLALINKDEDVIMPLEIELKNISNVGNFNWFTAHYYYILLLIHTKSYIKAYEIYLVVNSYKIIKN